jgi:hypothetical protein
LLVPRQSKCRRLESLQIVAGFASVEIGHGGKLPGMWVAMAIGALLELDFV